MILRSMAKLVQRVNVGKDVGKELTERQYIIISLLTQNNMVTISEMSLKAKVTARIIERDTEELTKRGIISREGGRKDGVWKTHLIH